MNLIEAYANLDNATKKQRLDEKIPRDLANAMKGADAGYINVRRSGRPANDWQQDFENNQYNEITPEEAIKLKKQGQANKIKVLIDGEFVDFYNDGTAANKSKWVRNSFGTLIKNADKIYAVDDSQANAQEKRAQRYKDNSLTYYGNDDSWYNSVRNAPISGDTGKHAELPKWEIRYEDSLNVAQRKLAKLEQEWEDGDISRKEYNREKEDIQSDIDYYKDKLEKIKEKYRNKEYDKRYDTDAKRMQSKLTRFKEIRKTPGEEDVKYAQSSLEKAEKEFQDNIAKKQQEIARLQKELDDMQSKGPESSWRYNSAKKDLERAKVNLEKQKKDLADLKAGRWSFDNMTNESLKRKNKRLVESYHDSANKIILDAVDTIVDDVINGSDIEDAVHEEIDSHCLIYTDDIIDLARYYDVIDTTSVANDVYEPLFDDLYTRASDKLDELNAGTDGIDESLNKKKSKKFTR